MDVSIIIVSWNVKEYLQKCIASVYRETVELSFEIFLVDNASKDGSVEMVRREFPEVKIIANSENQGFARANNRALEKCTGEYVLFLNPDTEIKENAIGKLMKFIKADPRAAAAAPKLIYEDGRLQLICMNFPSPFTDLMETFHLNVAFPRSRFFNYYEMGLWPHDSTREVDQPAGACLMVKMEVLKKIGFYDERFFMYYDDVDLCYRIKKSGGRIFLVHDILVVHHGCKSSSQNPEGSSRWISESKIKFFRKHYGRTGSFLFGCNLVMRTIIVYVLFNLSHLIIGRPKHIKIVRGRVVNLWKDYLKK
ncbi:MAG: hypothetical protein A2452_01415 [Candidatus Firestonebacteria bacterium RIFOXYC2_FULL_39_67]|nr:MAG: hypothetical protein A2536_03045 [Candidatus Firestonebacteria bacterium RIFOXYD2_FULL_39_29]OGF53610.1 MAG: hypothetical protein A2452_01415 [Candidatus Firestonebacteria bacterium RIFOXYC2_FULL_39_67]